MTFQHKRLLSINPNKKALFLSSSLFEQANPSSSKSLGTFSALRVASLLLGQVFQEWEKTQ